MSTANENKWKKKTKTLCKFDGNRFVRLFYAHLNLKETDSNQELNIIWITPENVSDNM